MTSNKLAIAVAVWGLTVISIFQAAAAEPLRGGIEFDRIDVPADQPSVWPKEIERFDDISRDEFLTLIEQIHSRDRSPRPASLKSAYYEATLVHDTLRGGTLTASVQRLDKRNSLLELGKFSFALEELRWQDRAAVWGSSPDGRTWVLAGENRDELLGEWSCKGRRIPGGVDFDLQLPQATISFLDLRIPREYSISAPTGEVTLMSDIAQEETRLWRIRCASGSHCRMTCVAHEGIESNRRALIVEHDMQVDVREEDLRFQLNLYLEALDAPVRDLVIQIPPGLEIYSAVYGAENSVELRRPSEIDADRRWSIHLPGPLSGRRRTLRINGIAVQKPGQETVLPQVTVEDSIFEGGRLNLTIQPPLEVRSIRPNGYVQRSSDGEQRFTFEQLTPNSQLILGVHRSSVSLSGQVLGMISLEDDGWNMTSEIVWTSQKGNAYQTSCLLPAEWEVTEVRLKSDNSYRRPNRLGEEGFRPFNHPAMNWELTPYDGQKSKLSIEFLDAIPSGQSRAVKIFARRRSAEVGKPVAVPVPQLLNSETAAAYLGIEIPTSMTSVISTESRLERIARPNLSVFEVPEEHPNTERRWYRGDTTDGSGTIRLTPRLEPVVVQTDMTIETLRAEYRTKYSIRSDRPLSQTDRLLVYLSEPNADVRWIWKGFQSIELSAAKLPRTEHHEWNLPLTGELWELRLPRTLRGEGSIEGTATSRWSTTNRPALIFVPQAVDKRVSLNISNPESLDLNLDTDGLKADGQSMAWWYLSPQADFGISLHNSLPSQEFPLMVSMDLKTLMSADADGADLYRARVQLENGSANESLKISLDPDAVLLEVRVDGELIATPTQSSEFSIPGLNAARRDLVEISYRMPTRPSVLFERRRIVVPRVSAQVLGFFWEFGIPSSTRLFSEPSGVHLSKPLPMPTWTERLFGPLGRSTGEPIFNPFRRDSWLNLVRPIRIVNENSEEELIALNQASAPDLPTDLEVELWQAERIEILAWLSLGISLLVGSTMRMYRWWRRDRLAAYALGLLLACSLSTAMPYSSFSGGAIAGILIVLLLPYRLLRRTIPTDQVTVEYRNVRAAIVATIIGGATYFLLASVSGSIGFAQESASSDTSSSKRPRVYIPVDKDGTPSETMRLVYAPHDALERWKAIAHESAAKPKYLISSARYELSGATETMLRLLAKFRIHVLDTDSEMLAVALPLSEVILPSADSCKVNGATHPISILPNGRGYSIDLPRKPASKSESEEEPSSNNDAEERVTTYEIELDCRKVRSASGPAQFTIPPVANSQLSFTSVEPIPYVSFTGGLGSVTRLSVVPAVNCELGVTNHVEVNWGLVEPSQSPCTLSTSLLQHIELNPAYAELIFHFVGTVEEGELDALEFDLPPNAVVRKDSLRAEHLLRTDTIDSSDGVRRLRLVFDEPIRNTVTVDGALILTQREAFAPLSLPKFGLAPSKWYDFKVARKWAGIAAPSDFQLTLPNLAVDNTTSIATDDYLSAWKTAAENHRSGPLIKLEPQLVFDLREGFNPTFDLVPYRPQRRATQWKQYGLIGKGRLDWTLVGEVETSHTPTFQISLLVDRRIRIEEISVKENKAERLNNRWTESRGELSRGDLSRVVLFLGSKAQGTQTITLRGSMPIVPGSPIVLPTIRAEDCDTPESRLTLAHDPEIEVAFMLPPEWKPVTLDESLPASFRTNSPAIKGTFQLNPSSPVGTIQTSARHSRCTSRALVRLRRSNDSSNWRLHYRLELKPEGDSSTRMGLSFPDTISDIDSVTVGQAEAAWHHEVRDGMRQLDLLLNRSDGPSTAVVEYEMSLSEPSHTDWKLNLPVPQNSTKDEILLLVEPNTIWLPATSREATVEELAKWEIEPTEEEPSLRSAFLINGSSVELQRTVVTSEAREPAIRLLDQRIWLHREGRRSGIAQIFASSIRGDLEIRVPDRVSITSLFLDDRALALSEPVDGVLTIPLMDAAAEVVLTLTWNEEKNQTGIDSVSEPFLWPLKISVEQSLVAILPDEPTTISAKSGMTPIGILDRNLDLLEILLDRHAALGIDSRAASSNRSLIDQLQRQIKEQLPKEFTQGGQRVRQQLDRWSELVARINQLERAPDQPTINWYSRLIEESTAQSEYSIVGRTQGLAKVSINQFDWRGWRSVGAVLLSLILVLMLRRTIRIERSEWMQMHVAVSWLLLAAFWWLFLTPSALGPCLLVVALAKATSDYRTAKSIS